MIDVSLRRSLFDAVCFLQTFLKSQAFFFFFFFFFKAKIRRLYCSFQTVSRNTFLIATAMGLKLTEVDNCYLWRPTATIQRLVELQISVDAMCALI